MTKGLWLRCAALLGCGACAGCSVDARGAEPSPRDGAPPAPTAAPAPATPRAARLLFAGDVAMTGVVAMHLDAAARGEPLPAELGAEYPFSWVAPELRAADLAVVNLECVASLRGRPVIREQAFRAPPSSLRALAGAGVDIVSVANNHALDFGQGPFHDMVLNVRRAGLQPIGAASILNGSDDLLVVEAAGVRVGLLAYHWTDPQKACADVANARARADFLVVYNHWGDEFVEAPRRSQVRFGRALVDAGADLVVGTHAHVVQPAEVYQGRLIAYGLGNFVFTGHDRGGAGRVGALLEVEVGPEGMRSHRIHRVLIDAHGAPRIEGSANTEAPPD